MAQIISSEYESYDASKNLGLDEIYIKFKITNNGKTTKYMEKLSDLRIYTGDTTTPREIKSFADFKKNLKDVIYVTIEGDNVGTKVEITNENDQILSRTFTIPTQYESSFIEPDGESAAYGAKRVNPVIKSGSFNTKKDDKTAKYEYVYVQLAGESKHSFYPVNELGYYAGGTFVPLKDKSVGEFKDKTIYTTNGKAVQNIYTEATFTFKKSIAQEKIDASTLTREMYELDENGEVVMEKDASGNDVPKMTTEPLDDIYSEHTFIKVDGKTKLKVKNYNLQPSGEGDYMQVCLEGKTTPMMFSINSLYLINADGTKTQLDRKKYTDGEKKEKPYFDREALKSIIGQKLAIKQGEDYLITEPVTSEQALLSYSSITQRIETTKEPDMNDDTLLLRLEDGRYIRENSAVRPIAYDFVKDDSDYDALFVKYTASDGTTRGIIVPKDTFTASKTHNINGINVSAENAFKVKKSTKALEKCDVIQTTNKPGEKYHETYLLKQPKWEEGVLKTDDLVRTDEEINGVKSGMIEAYKKGEYVLEEVVDDEGKLVPLDRQHRRYIETDYRYEEDYANKADHYDFLRMNPLKYNARTGKLEGGPHFDAVEANKEGFKQWVDVTTTVIAPLVSGPGILVGLAVPVVWVVALGAAVTGAIGIPVVNAIRAISHNHRKYNYKDKTEINRKQTTKQVEDDLQKLYDATKDKIAEIEADKKLTPEQKEAQKTIMERKFLDEYEQIDQRMKSMHTSKYYSEFKVVDGVAEVNEGNAPLMTKYREMLEKLDKEIKETKKLAKKDSSKEEELKRLEAKKEGMLQSYTSNGEITERDKEALDKLEGKAESMRGLVLAKFFGRTEGLTEKDELTADEKAVLHSFEYNNGVEYGKLLTSKKRKDLKKTMNKDAIDKYENSLDKTAQALRKKFIKCSKAVEYKPEDDVIISKPKGEVATPPPASDEGAIPPKDTKKESKKVERKKVTTETELSEDALKNFLKELKELKSLLSEKPYDGTLLGTDTKNDKKNKSELEKKIKAKYKSVKKQESLIKKARKDEQYDSVYEPYDEEYKKLYKEIKPLLLEYGYTTSEKFIL